MLSIQAAGAPLANPQMRLFSGFALLNCCQPFDFASKLIPVGPIAVGRFGDQRN
jgi:hypothetical protein